MLYVNIQDQSKLVKYVMHAKHKKIYADTDKPEWLTNNEEGEWDAMLNLASEFV